MSANRSVPRLTTVLVLAMLAVLTMRCESQESPPVEKPREGQIEGPPLLQLDRAPRTVKILINRPQGTIHAKPPHPEICRTVNFCPEDEFRWWIPSGLKPGERLVIRGARDVCFDWPGGELEIPYPSNARPSGLFLPACEAADKYGFYWPYVIELYEGDEMIAETDPSGIFRR